MVVQLAFDRRQPGAGAATNRSSIPSSTRGWCRRCPRPGRRGPGSAARRAQGNSGRSPSRCRPGWPRTAPGPARRRSAGTLAMVSTMILTCSGPTQPPSTACASSGSSGAAMPPVINSRGQDLRGGLDPGGGVGGGDGERLPQQRLGGGAGPVLRDAEFLDFPGLVDLRRVDGPGQHFQAASEFELLVGQQFPECAVPNVPDRGHRRFDERVRLVDVGESGRGPYERHYSAPPTVDLENRVFPGRPGHEWITKYQTRSVAVGPARRPRIREFRPVPRPFSSRRSCIYVSIRASNRKFRKEVTAGKQGPEALPDPDDGVWRCRTFPPPRSIRVQMGDFP